MSNYSYATYGGPIPADLVNHPCAQGVSQGELRDLLSAAMATQPYMDRAIEIVRAQLASRRVSAPQQSPPAAPAKPARTSARPPSRRPRKR